MYRLNKIFRLDVDDSGLTALVRLSNGDMRKALNILQVSFLLLFFKRNSISFFLFFLFFKSLFLECLFWNEFCQSTHMASQHIDEEAVYLCTGNPMPKDIEQITYWLLNDSFSDGFRCILCRTYFMIFI